MFSPQEAVRLALLGDTEPARKLAQELEKPEPAGGRHPNGWTKERWDETYYVGSHQD